MPIVRHRPFSTLLALSAVTAAVLGFAHGWPGEVLSDGPGVRMFVRLALEAREGSGSTPYWIDQMWGGTPAWALGPFFTIAWLLPVAGRYGIEQAQEISTLLAQIAAGAGVYLLARSLWERVIPATIAGLLYALSPMIIGHGTLFGLTPLIWVFAAIPWFGWAFRRALLFGGRWVAVSSLVGAFALLQQAEHAYAVALLALSFLVVAVTKAGSPALPVPATRVVARAAVAAIGVAFLSAHWLLPFGALHESFVLTDPESARYELTQGGAAIFGSYPQVFVKPELRSLDEPSAYDYARSCFYLGVATIGAAVAGLLLLRRDRDGWLTATAIVAAIALWLSTGGVALARGTLGIGGGVSFAVLGFVGGVLLGATLRRVRDSRWRTVGWVGALGFLAVFPLFAPFLALQDVVPLLDTLRFPRFYPVALLGVCLLAAFPIAVAGDAVVRSLPRAEPWFSAALALCLAGLAFVDLVPYRDFYDLRHERRAAEGLEELRTWAEGLDPSERIATQMYDRPAVIEQLQASGRTLTVGWPHPIAGSGVWHLTGETYYATRAYARRATGLLGTTLLVSDPGADKEEGETRVSGFRVTRNGAALPIARVYDRAVVTSDPVVAGRLAPALAPAGVATITATAIDPMPGVELVQLPAVGCPDLTAATAAAGLRVAGVDLVGEVARACALDRWLGLPHTPTKHAAQSDTVTVVVPAPAAGLDGIAFDLDRPPGPATVSVRQVVGDGFGPILGVVRSEGVDADGLWRFRFPDLRLPPGQEYGFTLACPDCGARRGPRLRVVPDLNGEADVAIAGQRLNHRVAMAVPLYRRAIDRGAPARPATARRTGAGAWQIDAPREGLAVLATANFAGWKATGATAATTGLVLSADSGLVGVPVSGAGIVDVAWTEPGAAGAGRVLSVVALVVAILAIVIPRRVWHRLAALGTPPRPMPVAPKPLEVVVLGPVSAVVATYNDGDNISLLLERLLAEPDVCEVVVVASGCTDDTVGQVMATAATNPPGRVRVIVEPHRTGKANALNMGFTSARAPFVLAISGDILPEPGAVRGLRAVMRDPDVGMSGGRPVPVNDPDTFMGHAVHLLWRLHHRMALHRPKLGEMVMLRTGVATTLPLTSVDEACMQALVEHAGYRCEYVPDVIVHNRGPEHVRDFLLQRRRIHAGHLRLEDHLDYLTPSLDVSAIGRDLLKELGTDTGRGSVRRFLWSAGTVVLEAAARLLAHFDLVLGRDHHVWKMVETAKNPARAGDGGRPGRCAGVPEVGVPAAAAGERHSEHELPLQLHVRDVQRVRAEGEGAHGNGVGAGVPVDGPGAGMDDVQRR